MLEVALNLHKFPLTALYDAAEDGVVYRPVPVGALSAPTQGLHVQVLLIYSFFSYAPCVVATIVPR